MITWDSGQVMIDQGTLNADEQTKLRLAMAAKYRLQILDDPAELDPELDQVPDLGELDLFVGATDPDSFMWVLQHLGVRGFAVQWAELEGTLPV